MKIIYDFTPLHQGIGRIAKQLQKFMIENAKQNARWGTFGLAGKDPLKVKRLIDCSTEHLQAILDTQPHIRACCFQGFYYDELIKSILKDRGVTVMTRKPDFVNKGSMWLVIYECIHQVVQVSPDGKGFFACGQEPLWSFDNVTEWIVEIKPPQK